MSARPTRVVFVGNIPYDLTEPQLIDIFKEVGPVVSFRLVFDRESGKPKGYGFCTFQDAETASSAVRNLNNYDVGGRQLRIDFAESDKEDSSGRLMPASASDDRHHQSEVHSSMMPPSGHTPIEAVNRILSSYPPEQMLEVLAQMKFHVENNPAQVRLLLNENPQLTYALFQALLVMNVVEPGIMQRILQAQGTSSQGHNRQQQPPAAQPPISQQVSHAISNLAFVPSGSATGAPSGIGHIQQAHQIIPSNPSVSLPSVSNGDVFQEQQKQLLLQVLNLTPEQIQALPPDQRDKISQLRAQILG